MLTSVTFSKVCLAKDLDMMVLSFLACSGKKAGSPRLVRLANATAGRTDEMSEMDKRRSLSGDQTGSPHPPRLTHT